MSVILLLSASLVSSYTPQPGFSNLAGKEIMPYIQHQSTSCMSHQVPHRMMSC